MDEPPEFPRSVLESLRQPLEDGRVVVARVAGHALFPARFQLIGTINLSFRPVSVRSDPGSRQRLTSRPTAAVTFASSCLLLRGVAVGGPHHRCFYRSCGVGVSAVSCTSDAPVS